LDGHIWALKADSLISPLIVTVTATVAHSRLYYSVASVSLSSVTYVFCLNGASYRKSG